MPELLVKCPRCGQVTGTSARVGDENTLVTHRLIAEITEVAHALCQHCRSLFIWRVADIINVAE